MCSFGSGRSILRTLVSVAAMEDDVASVAPSSTATAARAGGLSALPVSLSLSRACTCCLCNCKSTDERFFSLARARDRIR